LAEVVNRLAWCWAILGKGGLLELGANSPRPQWELETGNWELGTWIGLNLFPRL